MKDYYEILGLERDATVDDIKKTFRRLARETHPDANPDDPVAEARFREIAEAYEVLSDPQRRSAYDRGDQFDASGLFSQFAGIEDLLNSFFGGGVADFGGFGGRRTARRVKGPDIASTAEITLEEAASGVQREITLRSTATCTVCGGTGADADYPPTTCTQCAGAGAVRATRRTMLGAMTTVATCEMCNGSGQVIEHVCEECRGRGVIDDAPTLVIDIPAGIGNGSRLRLVGKGGSAGAAGPAGDLYVTVGVVLDERFRREGDDLIHTLHLGLAEAALGKTVTVPLLGGESTDVDVPAGTQPGTVFQLQRKGMPRLQRRGRGDLLVEVVIDVPTDLTSEQADSLRHYGDLRGETPSSKRRKRRLA